MSVFQFSFFLFFQFVYVCLFCVPYNNSLSSKFVVDKDSPVICNEIFKVKLVCDSILKIRFFFCFKIEERMKKQQTNTNIQKTKQQTILFSLSAFFSYSLKTNKQTNTHTHTHTHTSNFQINRNSFCDITCLSCNNNNSNFPLSVWSNSSNHWIKSNDVF